MSDPHLNDISMEGKEPFALFVMIEFWNLTKNNKTYFFLFNGAFCKMLHVLKQSFDKAFKKRKEKIVRLRTAFFRILRFVLFKYRTSGCPIEMKFTRRPPSFRDSYRDSSATVYLLPPSAGCWPNKQWLGGDFGVLAVAPKAAGISNIDILWTTVTTENQRSLFLVRKK